MEGIKLIERFTTSSFEVPNRQFQLWSFKQTHCRLLLQSNPSSDLGYETRIEVLFPGVDFVSVPSNFTGLHVRRADRRTSSAALETAQLDEQHDGQVFLLSPGKDWFVISGPPSLAETRLRYNDPSVFTPQGLELEESVVYFDLADKLTGDG
ncbi:hypothetical protein [Catelliglobosispora koreensis]|uniref:hypothetical protein n=1 Tax=Catelliglobosispora koreensis TaxID=129052 RepID=UPI00058E1BEF|nr:hypothetical protein [Catelliglobosispora koreensis]